MTRTRLTLAALGCTLMLISLTAWAERPSLETLMADPAWMGSPVEAAWWQLDGEAIIYRTGREGSDVKDLHWIDLASGEARALALEAHHDVHGEAPVWCRQHARAVYSREGNLFVYRRADGDLRQLTRGPAIDRDARFTADGDAIVFRRDSQWWQLQLATGLAWPVSDLRFEVDPDAAPDDVLATTQLRLFSSLRADAERAREQREHAIVAARTDRTRAVAPWYLGADHRLAESSLSPDGRWLLAVVEPADHEAGRSGRMPHYVTVDGHVDLEEVRTRVGRNPPASQTLWLLDLHTRERHVIALDELGGIDADPLAELKAAQGIAPLGEDELRPVSVLALAWQPEGGLLAVQLRANDNKDRWLAVLDPATQALTERHRLTDEAWINRTFNEFGWIPGTERLWLLSEGSGYSHLYSVGARRGRPRAHSSGSFEVMAPQLLADGRTMLLLSNRSHPTEYDLYRVDLQGGQLERITRHRGIESYAVLPGETRVLVRYSEPYLPAQAALVSLADGSLTALTDTRSASFRAIAWQAPEIVGVPSSHGAGTVWAKFYPARGAPPTPAGHPAVLFVHGAGYLQNVHLRYPQYFREQMFHTLLTARGYHVLDMDFRASRGYGRDWRTAIYRQMGTPELEDLVDGVRWLVEEHAADPTRIGLYGGSYGGFMTFMAMFNAPEVFAAGAALRPVTDWMHYNHRYTSNILNTPEIDPEAYRRSSPIEFAEGLEGSLLITHGMLDDNVFYQDVVRLAQRLIDLEKGDWELASYPLERHAFSRPSSWLDQYRRILALFERTIGAPAQTAEPALNRADEDQNPSGIPSTKNPTSSAVQMIMNAIE